MATITVPVTAPGARRWPWSAAFSVLVLALLAIIGTASWFYLLARSSLPQLDGGSSGAGLSAPVKVMRDGHGVPTIDAASLEDLLSAQGYFSAQDRLWPIDIIRPCAAGEISQILGSDFLS